MKRIISFTLTILIFGSGCVSVGYESQAAKNIKDAHTICIIHHPSTREGFERAMKAWLEHYNYEVNVLPVGSDVSECPWSLTYYGKWSWDGAIYLADAEIIAYQNGTQIGKSKFEVAGGAFNINPNKFESGDARVQEMMNRLFEPE